MKEINGEHKDRNLEMIQVEKEKELRSLKNKELLWQLSGFIKKGSIRIMGIPGEEMEKRVELLFKDNIWEFLKPGELTGFTHPWS